MILFALMAFPTLLFWLDPQLKREVQRTLHTSFGLSLRDSNGAPLSDEVMDAFLDPPPPPPEPTALAGIRSSPNLSPPLYAKQLEKLSTVHLYELLNSTKRFP